MPIKIFRYIIISFTIYGFTASIAQEKNDCQLTVNDPFEVVSARPCEGNYLYPIQKIISNKDFLLKKMPENLYYQSLASAYCNLGDHIKSLASWDIQSRKLPEELRNDFSGYKPVNAQNELRELIGNHRLVMINEAHHISMHRFFVRQLLQDFFDQGFKYLAIEALNQHEASELVTRGFPLESSGTYTIEPQFGQLIRSALRIGFKLISYDVSEGNMNLRDSLQALNIIQHIHFDEGDKVLIYAGFGHIREYTSNNWVTLAQSLNHQTGINPLTIDQVQLTEKSSTEYQSSTYNELTKNYSLSHPFLLKNDENDYWMRPQDEGVYDLQIIHPVTSLKFGRPNWLNTDSTLNKRKIYVPEATQELLVQAYSFKECELFAINDLIPFDQTTIQKGENNCFLYLPKGEFIIRIISVDGFLDQRLIEIN